jgi:cytochrome c biogenesis protein
MTDVHSPQAGPAEAEPPLDPALGERDAADAPVARPAAGHFGVAAWARWGWRQLTSMRVALVLLFLLALGSVPGSLLPQQGIDPAAVQQYYDAHPSLAPVFNDLGLFNVFAAPWFAAIYLLLFISLAGCVLPRAYRPRPPRSWPAGTSG